MNVAIIGGGAAGFFAAINAKENHPQAKITIFEKTQKILSKVKISGGGRCNLTNACNSISELSKAYPRGEKSLKKLFHVFNNQDAMVWFKQRGVEIVVQDDNCVFPLSQDSQTVIDCFFRETNRLNISIKRGFGVSSITSVGAGLEIHFANQSSSPECFDKVIVCTGGSPQEKGLQWLADLGHTIESPVPSLFTFAIPSDSITQLMGLVVENTQLSIQGTKFKSDGALLLTHWGMSGPAILKLSSYAARYISQQAYHFKLQVNWVNETNCDKVYELLQAMSLENPNKMLCNKTPYQLQMRLWAYILHKAELPETKKWGELGKKAINKLVTILTNDVYEVKGRSVFRDEFVTCGGVSLDSINIATMQSKVCPGLYFAGEVLDIDAITGGYNFQAAWTTAFVAAKLQ